MEEEVEIVLEGEVTHPDIKQRIFYELDKALDFLSWIVYEDFSLQSAYDKEYNTCYVLRYR